MRSNLGQIDDSIRTTICRIRVLEILTAYQVRCARSRVPLAPLLAPRSNDQVGFTVTAYVTDAADAAARVLSHAPRRQISRSWIA